MTFYGVLCLMFADRKEEPCDLSVHLLDADGTIFNALYDVGRNARSKSQPYSEIENIASSNNKLIEYIANDATPELQIESFSLRQSLIIEARNSRRENDKKFK